MPLELTPWKRSVGLRPFWREMEDLWDRFLEEMPLAERPWGWTPPVDLSETDGSVHQKYGIHPIYVSPFFPDTAENCSQSRVPGEKYEENSGCGGRTETRRSFG